MTVKTILSKPLPVIWFRLVQLVRLKIYKRTNFWRKKSDSVSKQISSCDTTWKKESLLFSSKFQGYEELGLDRQRDFIRRNSDHILKGNISIFDLTYTFNVPLTWNMDWRVDHRWENKYFKEYGFYEKEKLVEYDVKFPWELSRLSFLIPVARRYLLDGEKQHLEYLHETLGQWKNKNPLAHSVNWYAMEVSIRTINLVQIRELLVLGSETEETINLLNEILILHGIFLWRNIEFTDVRGNHYAANLTALLLLGTIFIGFYPEANKWQKYALNKIESEFWLQFIKDGVNFEKSIPYHRLVVELFLICFLVIERLGVEIQPNVKDLLYRACNFTKDCSKPNNSSPIIGDNDSASVFQNDEIYLNDHSNLLQLAGLFLEQSKLNSARRAYISSLELFGHHKTKELISSPTKELKMSYYDEGGFVIIKDETNFFITDVGEVGMKGRGGHGHNDVFSFELMLDRKDLIVDAGCYTYTGDLGLKNEMKSSAYHNILTIDNHEVAPLKGNWGISDIAKPLDVIINENDEMIQISGKHKGYERLLDPVVYKRSFSLIKGNFQLNCTDTIKCLSQHRVARHFHFAEGVKLELSENRVLAKVDEKTLAIFFDQYSKASLTEYWLSYNYGHKVRSNKLILETEIKGSKELFFTISKNSEDE